jgi:Na+-driven multidrug efflux pump
MNDASNPPSAKLAHTGPAGISMPAQLPAQKRDPVTGVVHVDYRAVAALALPLMANSSLQAVISLTDTWFIGHISTVAMAGMAAVYWVILLFLMLIGGVGLAVQTFVAQAEGSRRRSRASHATWVAMWASVLTLPFYAGLAWLGGPLLAPFGLPAEVQEQALAFWQPRMLGAPMGVMLWAILGFFNGISRPRITVMTTGLVAIVNGVLNWVFIFKLEGGIAGSAWATNISMGCGVLFAFGVFLRPDLRNLYKSHLTWRPEMRSPCVNIGSDCRWARVRGRSRPRAVPADAGAPEPGRGRGDADRDDADIAGLYAGHGHRTGRHAAGAGQSASLRHGEVQQRDLVSRAAARVDA